MPRLIKLAPALLLVSLFLQAQTAPQLTNILERLDRLEQENRALSEQVKTLQGEVSALRSGTEAAQTAADGRLELQERRIEEQAQAKVEASQNFQSGWRGWRCSTRFWIRGRAAGPTIRS